MASGRDMMLQVVVKLRDQLSQGLNGALNKIRSWGTSATRIFASVGRGIGNLLSSVSLLGVGIAAGLMDGLRSFREFDDAARQTAVNLRKYGAEGEAWIKSTHTWAQGLTKATGQTSQDILNAQKELIGAGLPEGVANTMVPQIAKTATAASAELADMTQTSKVLFQSWDIGADRMGNALGMLFEAGRQGNFELKAMAKALPSIAPLMASIGSKGERAVAIGSSLLQVSKMGAGSDEEAANNFRNFLSKIPSPDFKKNMKGAGVDVDAVLKDAAIKGLDPVESALQKVIKVTGADKAARQAADDAKKRGLSAGDTWEAIRDRVATAIEGSKVGEVLPDMQAKTFIASYLAHRDEYLKMRDTVMKTDPGEASKAFDLMMAGPLAQQRMASESVEQVSRRFGSSLTGLADIFDAGATKLKGVIDQLDGISPKIVDIGAQLALAASAIGGIWGALRMFGIGAPAAVAAAAAPEAAVPAAVASAGLFSRVMPWLGRASAAYAGFSIGKWISDNGITPLAETAGGKNWTPKTPDALTDLRQQLAEAEAKIAEIQGRSKMPEMAETMSAPYRTRAADLRNRIAAGERGETPQKVDVSGSITVKVDGPGQVTGVSSTNPQVPLSADRGQNGGRP